MAYITLADVKDYLDIQTTADDALITSLIPQAEKAIDTFTHRHFEAQGDSTRYFDAVRDTDRRDLFVDEDLASVTTVLNDGTAITSPTDYIPVPRNRTPYYALRILCQDAWCYSDCPEDAVEITGEWVFSLTPPEDIKHACLRLVSFYYRQKDSQVFNEISILEAGVISTPPGIPADVRLILQPYVKVAT